MSPRTMMPPPDDIVFRIPKDLLMKFEVEPRIIIKYPWIIGIPIPEWLIKNPELLGRATEEFDAMLIPKELYK